MAEDHSSLACQLKAMITNEGSKVVTRNLTAFGIRESELTKQRTFNISNINGRCFVW